MTEIDPSIRNSLFCQEMAATPLRVTCYGSSSSKTPAPYLQEARHLGYILAKRGHTCVNGAGSFGCMAAMNDGAVEGNGHIVGVIHEMWLVDQGDWESSSVTTNPVQVGKTLRDGGAHSVFMKNGGGNGTPNSKDGPVREMLVAGGDNLQERKKLLVDKANALVVLPGGPGTWDELWEMACARKLGMNNALPICVINIRGYYQPFFEILERAHRDKLLDQKPEEIIKFVSTAQEAVEWVEKIQESDEFADKVPTLQTRSTVLRKSSFMGSPPTGNGILGALSRSISYVSESFLRTSFISSDDDDDDEDLKDVVVEEEVWTAPKSAAASHLVMFASGAVLGALILDQFNRSNRTR